MQSVDIKNMSDVNNYATLTSRSPLVRCLAETCACFLRNRGPFTPARTMQSRHELGFQGPYQKRTKHGQAHVTHNPQPWEFSRAYPFTSSRHILLGDTTTFWT
ncbi:hypothetical protein TGPRC2_221585 [Toxoplasma gondii TgCatPRC2]|uniref:Uncharacterized protein n=11 Tax=Toxoplasma gondii TaxID=5811 RepID=A0A125YG16_TOXGV|nr:hypothetical protein TGME49_221585 [Toxoplasma gondii ME49]EPR58583.1 hypothetical protein TGGT1_221585 [Toxoplasma gondii GT1]ESS30104.1 hypothetical protein TGVEG_221585 [Toxoplasma gondii VEG]KAF4645579.1 hypothetical protein TGRH88_000660 [Toxoplasma gondii]KFG36387.1 hypothetical protein TGP89_221585 [Toxoplasma gondii p89]KFG41471.1 hypothetical protein TGDOM2_221585 [Toxoplasma gondii GAB2-2007-GAL-DOM2]KFG47487.1 hypothetical protein TGFOU_221585 [Toxoplasma gondii FOU]KFG61088.1 |eukprot:XP_018638277.1 hypothetical protein TGME49_221585 [Toxoplasma gondii ME49]